jgi:hypothetical protein
MSGRSGRRASAEDVMRWFEKHRIEWIAEALRVFGYINRDHLVRKFGLSNPQASRDLRKFHRLFPAVMSYDASAKRYVYKRKRR